MHQFLAPQITITMSRLLEDMPPPQMEILVSNLLYSLKECCIVVALS